MALQTMPFRMSHCTRGTMNREDRMKKMPMKDMPMKKMPMPMKKGGK